MLRVVLIALADNGFGSYGLKLSVPVGSPAVSVALSLVLGVPAAVLPARRAGKLNGLAALPYR